MPAHLAERILRERPSIEGERRIVTVLFADAVGSTPIAEQLGEEEMYQLMRGCFSRMIEAIHQYEGHVVQFTGDGIMAVFGAPIAHEESERRAVAAALRLQGSLEDYACEVRHRHAVECRFRVGLNTGPVVVGRISDALEMDVTAIGDTVNIAARMQQMADPGAIYLAENTHRAVQDFFECEPLGALTVKGKAQPVKIYHAIRERPPRTRFEVATTRGLAPLAGREPELDTLVRYLSRAQEGGGQVVFVSGDAGIGKSRLLLEFRRQVADTGTTWVQGQCSAHRKGIAFLPLIDIVRAVFGVVENDHEARVISLIDQGVSAWGSQARRCAPYLRYLLGVDPGDPAVIDLDPRVRRGRIFDCLRTLLAEEGSRRPLVVAIEDLHWIDPISERSLAVLLDAVPTVPVLIVLTFRRGRTHALGERPYFNRLALQPLPEAESFALIRHVFGTAAVPEGLSQLIAGKAEGNPFFIEELIRSLMESGIVTSHADAPRLNRPIGEIRLPSTVGDVILSRIDCLGANAKTTIQMASVIGREFAVRLLNRVAGTATGVEDTLSGLDALDLIHMMEKSVEPTYAFKHALTQEVIYSTLLSERRRELHRRVGAALEELYAGDRIVELYETLARHYDEGAAWEKAVDYLARAGRKAATSFASQDALRYYTRAREVCAELKDSPLAASLASALERTTRTVDVGASREEGRFLEKIRDVVGADGCHESAYSRALYRRDASFLNAEPLAIVAPRSVEELAAIIRECRRFEIPFTPRGAGTGIAGGAVPLGPERRPLVVSLSRLDAILSLDPDQRLAWVEPGVLNVRLSEAAAPYGLRYAPDPSSQVACTLGGNVATNAGGAHCLAYGATSNHVLALELMDADGALHTFGSTAPEWNGYDLRGVSVGSEGTFGFVTKACLRLLPVPPVSKTVLFGFPTLRVAAQAVTAIIERASAPAALEIMDAAAVRLVEDYCHAGYPRGAGAVLLTEFEGLRHEVEMGATVAQEAAREEGSNWMRIAESDDERSALWKGRKAVAGALAQLVPEYYLHDVVVPRSRLADVVDEVGRIVEDERVTAVNVHHAGDGNLHPMLLFDRSEPGAADRVFSAGRRIVAAAIAAGGVLTGEHGIGIEKRDFLCEVLKADDLDAQLRVRRAMEPTGLANPGKVLPAPSSCGDRPVRLIPEGAWV